MATGQTLDLTAAFDIERGLLKANVYADAEIYDAEVEEIFGRCWLFVAPASWLKARGSYRTTTMGEVPVVVWRGVDGELRVFVNECPYSMVVLTKDERGVAEALVCACHNASYGSDGHVDGAPEYELHRVPRVEEYKGLVFACLDAGAPPLIEYLGDFAFYLDLLVDYRPAGVEAMASALRWGFEANWKLPAETYFGDVYRDATLHAANHAVDGSAPVSEAGAGYQISAGPGAIVCLTEGESATSGPVERSYRAACHDEVVERLSSVRAGLTPVMGGLFPNLGFDWATRSLHVWQPRGPRRTEVDTYCLVDREAPPEVREAIRRACQLYYGPAGFRSQDEVVPWQAITKLAAARGVSQNVTLNLQMGLGRESYHEDLPGRVSELVSEMNQRLFYYRWQRRLMGLSWEKGLSQPG